MQEFAVGERAPDVILGFDAGAHFLVPDDGSPILLLMYNRPTAKEIQSISSGSRFQYRMLYKDGLLLFLCKPGTENWIESFYRPTFGDDSALPGNVPDGEGLLLMVVLVDRSSGVIKHIRAIGLETEFSRSFVAAARASDKDIASPMEWQLKVAQAMQWTTRELADMASHHGQTSV